LSSSEPEHGRARAWAYAQRLLPTQARMLIRHAAGRLDDRSRHSIPIGPAVNELVGRYGFEGSEANPIFLMSAGWRSGSTLLQRLVNGGGSALVWGEPFSETDTLQRLAESCRAFHPTVGRFSGRVADAAELSTYDLAEAWTANLCTSPSALLQGHLALMDAAFAAPARAVGRSRWGVKEVRLSADHASWLRVLYPQASMVFLVRDPRATWQSYRIASGRGWYQQWPNQPVRTVRDFCDMWAKLATGFVTEHAALGGALVRYEDLASRDTLDMIEHHLGARLDRSAVEQRVGSSSTRAGYTDVTRAEMRYLQARLSRPAAAAGYDLSVPLRR
jgi:hypothetical protein